MVISDTHFTASHSESTFSRIRILLEKFRFTHSLILHPLFSQQLNILAPLRITIVDMTAFQTPVHIFISDYFQAICIPQPIIMGSNLRIGIINIDRIVLLPCQTHIFLIERHKILLTYFIRDTVGKGFQPFFFVCATKGESRCKTQNE